MSFIRLSRVSFSYSSSVDILVDVSMDLHAGWTGVVGENGSGKTTLLGLILGRLEPSSGTIALDPIDAVTHVCPQRVDAITGPIVEFAESWTRQASRIKARLELEEEPIERWPRLSPGERKRWQIGAALAAGPDILLLDEPTNHLDSHARHLLMAALARFRGIGLVVSHDRLLLEELTAHTVRVHRGRASIHRGAYEQAREQWQGHRRQMAQAHDKARKEQKALRRRLADERRKRSSAEAKISARSRIKGNKDSDARSMAAKNRVRAGEARLSRKVALLRDSVERADSRVESFEIVKERGRSLFIDYEPAPKRFLMALEGEALRVGERELLPEVRVAVERQSRIHVAGRNGAGKTTLLRALMAASAIERQRILFLPQVIPAEAARALVSEVQRSPKGERGRILQIAAALGLDPERVLATSSPSPGEIRKLAIARGLGRGAWAVILDEPTNHLDLPSIERLEAALIAYPGAIILVSHDEPFARAVTSTVWQLAGNRLTIEHSDAASLRMAREQCSA